jgi:hypothetical protein
MHGVTNAMSFQDSTEKGSMMENQPPESTTGILAINEIRRALFVDPPAALRECGDTKKDFLRLIRQRLQNSMYIAIRAIDVQFSDGKLYFRGVVPTFYTKQVLLSLAEDLGETDVVEIIDETTVLKH